MNLLPDAPPHNSSNEPLYNIGVVTRMTGISMATLRAWERRYNFPEASRTTGGHRLYSERDIMRLRWVKDRIGDGMQTAQAILALRHQEEAGTTQQEAIQSFSTQDQHPKAEMLPLKIYQDSLFKALLQRDLHKADQILGESLVISSPEEIIVEVIGPVMAEIGEAWENQKISIAIEHLTTNYLRQRLLMWMVSGPPAQKKPPIVLACAPNEWHEGSLLMLGALLRRQGWPVAYLGQAVPLPDLATFVRDIKPSVVVLVAMTENTAIELTDWPEWLPETIQSNKPIVCYGGRIFSQQPEWQERIPGIFLGTSITQGIKTLYKLLKEEV